MIFKKILSYLTFWKKQETPDGEPANLNLRVMHGINKISILMFLFCIIVIIIRYFF